MKVTLNNITTELSTLLPAPQLSQTVADKRGTSWDTHLVEVLPEDKARHLSWSLLLTVFFIYKYSNRKYLPTVACN